MITMITTTTTTTTKSANVSRSRWPMTCPSARAARLTTSCSRDHRVSREAKEIASILSASPARRRRHSLFVERNARYIIDNRRRTRRHSGGGTTARDRQTGDENVRDQYYVGFAGAFALPRAVRVYWSIEAPGYLERSVTPTSSSVHLPQHGSPGTV